MTCAGQEASAGGPLNAVSLDDKARNEQIGFKERSDAETKGFLAN